MTAVKNIQTEKWQSRIHNHVLYGSPFMRILISSRHRLCRLHSRNNLPAVNRFLTPIRIKIFIPPLIPSRSTHLIAIGNRLLRFHINTKANAPPSLCGGTVHAGISGRRFDTILVRRMYILC